MSCDTVIPDGFLVLSETSACISETSERISETSARISETHTLRDAPWSALSLSSLN